MQAERAWLAWVRKLAAAGAAPGALRLGIGDDAALLAPRAGWEVALTTDLMVEGVHFLRARDAAPVVGRRLATRALSDLAAMGAAPRALLVSCVFPPTLPAAWCRGLMRGLVAVAGEAGAALAGGDVASAGRGGRIALDVVGAGEVPRGRALRRDGARPGDLIYVSGGLGFAALGRALAHAGARAATSEQRAALGRHRRPRARWELGATLRGLASSAIDVSDGLSTDLANLCRASGVGAELEAAAIPRPRAAGGLKLALHGGEDYELLFTAPPRRAVTLAGRATMIGRIAARRGVRLNGRPLPPRGWEHFR